MQLCVHRLMQPLPEVRCELSAPIRHYPLWYSMQAYNPLHVQLCQSGACISGLHWKKVCHLGQAIHNHPNGVKSSLSARQTSDEVHTNFFPLPFRYLQRLEQSCWPLMFSLDSLTCVT